MLFFSSVSYNLNVICIFSFIVEFLATIEILARYAECYVHFTASNAATVKQKEMLLSERNQPTRKIRTYSYRMKQKDT